MKVICISRKGNNKLKNYIDGQKVEQVSQFRYLGSLISEDGHCTNEIKSRTEMAKTVFMEKKKLFTEKNESGTKEENNEMLGLSVALCSR